MSSLFLPAFFAAANTRTEAEDRLVRTVPALNAWKNWAIFHSRTSVLVGLRSK